MIFNKDKNGAQELRELTGNYYANNKFDKISGEIELATEELSSLIGDEAMKLAEKYYTEPDKDADAELVRKVQRPVAILATLRMYRKNDLSHEDDGRKFKMATDNSEKLPWEWQLDRDDALHLEEYYRAVDILIRYLNKKQLKEWTDTSLYKLSQTLIIRNGEAFDGYFPIERSERMYLMLVPFIREAQMLTVKRAYGSEWEELLKEKESSETDAHFAACKAVALLAMSMALRRLSLSAIPNGVIRKFMTENGMGESEPASLKDVERVAGWMADDAATWVNEMKLARNGGPVHYELLPKNDRRNKYCRL
ncbi:DUF6712 family protein [Bacteroides intestinalis]|jgi:hypothetical protein|uniref:Uncharacterized protein n=1 Tax=Siphoviridae sp. ctXQq5 TaxID=2826368 RepID=A0A8S5N0I0_9CAUD|nr:DUF6712 family protein [Bacteroides intestinalis]DAD88173.1 MAG TPA: hypothetical protein [Siphoviridae sp. ctXQq5]